MSETQLPLDLSLLPLPTVVEEISFETILAAELADLRSRDPAYTATVESDPAYKILEAASYRETLLRQRVNDAARRRLLAFAAGGDLDQLAAFYGVARQVIIPADLTASPPIDEVLETDASFRNRVREHIKGSSAAGTKSWYRYHALSATTGARDVEVDAPEGGTVRVSVLGNTDTGIPTEETLTAVSGVVLSDEIRGLCHAVSVVSADIVEVDIEANIKLLPTVQTTFIDTIDTAFRAAIEKSRGLGWDLTPSWIVANLQIAGVHSVELVTPEALISVAPNQCVHLQTLTLNYSGMAV